MAKAGVGWEAGEESGSARHMAPILEVRNLQVAYFSATGAATPALADVSFEVGPGEILGVLGESGSGKSTLARSLLRLLPFVGRIQHGSILFEGQDMVRAGPRVLQSIRGRRLSLINQEPSLALHPTMQVGDQIGEVLAAHQYAAKRTRRQRIRQVLEAVFPEEVQRISSSYRHQLSGGQQQRVLIAQAIACGPSMLVADEPTAALDPTTRDSILSLFRDLRQKFGLAIILITHNPSLLADLADRVLVLYAGRVAEIGPAETVLSSPLHPYTRALLRCLPPPPGKAGESNRKTKLFVVPGDSPDPGFLPPGCRFEPRCLDRFEICRKREPGPVFRGEGHAVSCFKFGD